MGRAAWSLQPAAALGDPLRNGLQQSKPSDCRLLALSAHNPAGIVWRRRRCAGWRDLRDAAASWSSRNPLRRRWRSTGIVTAPSHRSAARRRVQRLAGKTFNIAGVVVLRDRPRRALRRRTGWLEAGEFHEARLLSVVATRAAFTPKGDAWRAADAAVRRGERRLHRRLSAAIRSHPGDPPRSVVPRLARLPGTGAGPRCARRPLRRTRAGLALNDGRCSAPAAKDTCG